MTKTTGELLAEMAHEYPDWLVSDHPSYGFYAIHRDRECVRAQTITEFASRLRKAAA